jgi:beta-lactamase superfamily II metal-dependent hydrolase
MKGKRRLAILDVGHGNCAVLVDAKGVVVIDAGPKSGLLEFLAEQKIKRLNVVLLSHADKDHISGLLALLGAKTVAVDRIYVNTDSLKTSQLWDDLLYELNAAKKAGKIDFDVSLVEDRSGKYDQGDVRIEILAPSAYLAGKGPGSKDRKRRKLESNSVSAVVRLVLGNRPVVLLPGDIDDVGLANMIEGGGDARAPILVFPHHGGKACRDMPRFVQTLLALTQAETVLFSVTRGEAKHPDPAVIAAVRACSAAVRIACTQISEHCARSVPGGKPQHLAPIFARGRESNACCAGSFVIELDKSSTLWPEAGAHGKFVKQSAPTALCRR